MNNSGLVAAAAYSEAKQNESEMEYAMKELTLAVQTIDNVGGRLLERLQPILQADKPENPMAIANTQRNVTAPLPNEIMAHARRINDFTDRLIYVAGRVALP